MLTTVLLAAVGEASANEAFQAKGTPAFDEGQLSDFRLLGQTPNAAYSFVVVTNQPFKEAIRIQVAAPTPNAWDVQILTPTTTVPLQKGDYILATLYARCVDAPSGLGIISAYFQGSGSSWTGIGSETWVVGKEWKRFYIHGLAKEDFAPGEYELTLHLGIQPQALELGGIVVMNLGSKVDINSLPFTPIRYIGQEVDALWRKAAAERIQKYRKADVTVSVVDQAGQPVKGAEVHIQMQRHAYGFGTFLESGVITGTGLDADKLREWTLKLFNRCTTPIYWSDWGWANPVERERYRQCAKWAFDNALATRGHCIIYPGWEFLPLAVRKLEGDPPALRKRLLEQVVEVTEATRPFRFREYDVCNELRNLKEIHNLLGREAVAEWFKVAREHAPDSRMAINENTILTRRGITQAEQDNYAEWIQYLVNQGQGPDVIGMQAHFDEAVTDPETVLRILSRFEKFGKPIQITEFDLITRDEQGQAQYTRDFLTAVFSHPSTEAFTMWGFWEGRMWQPVGAMIRKNRELKPNGQAYRDLVFKEWWTDVRCTTDADGLCSIRGFKGDYKIIVTADEKETVREFKLTNEAARIFVTLDKVDAR